jgi:hypothetical protein
MEVDVAKGGEEEGSAEERRSARLGRGEVGLAW